MATLKRALDAARAKAKPADVVEADADTGGRDWSATILIAGKTLAYPWVAFNAALGTFATTTEEHARRFTSEQEVLDWAERLGVQCVTPGRVRNGRVVGRFR